MSSSRPFEDQTALVAGASSGIGASIALALARAGAAVSLVARRREELEKVASAVREAGSEAAVVVADLSDRDAPERAFAAATEELGPVDILVNNAATPRTAPVHDLAPRHWDLGLRLNLTVPYLLTRLALPGMRQRRRGWIVNISSEGGLLLGERTIPYAMTKRALNYFTEVVDLENRDHGVRAVSVCPGWVRTEMAVDPAVFGVPEEDLLEPDDIADVVMWLIMRPPHMEIGPVVPVRPTSRRAQTQENWERYLHGLLTGHDEAAAALAAE